MSDLLPIIGYALGALFVGFVVLVLWAGWAAKDVVYDEDKRA